MKEHINCIDIDRIKGKRLLCLVDGDHYPPVTKWALGLLGKKGGDVVSVVFVSGSEKVKNAAVQLRSQNESYRLYVGDRGMAHTIAMIRRASAETFPDIAVDLSDEPLLNYQDRFRIASTLLQEGIEYMGSDFYFGPPMRKDIMIKPSISVVGTGKRVGKTAINIAINRILTNAKFDPIVVAMGRGGPEIPDVVLPKKMELTPEYLMDVSRKGMHAASDYWEDAMLAGVPTIGCRRAGGGMAGNPFASNVIEGARIANSMPQKYVVFEGSGPSYPPIMTNGAIVVIGAGQPLDHILNYLGEFRVASSDLAIVTMCEEPIAEHEKIKALERGIIDIKPTIDLALTVFRPEPFCDISNKSVFVATTAVTGIGDKICGHLEDKYGCSVCGYSNNLADRASLEKDLNEGLCGADMLLTEIKAASIDMAASMANAAGIQVSFIHNCPVLVGGTVKNLEKAMLDTCTLARDRFLMGRSNR